MTRDRSTKLAFGAYEVICRLGDQPSGYLVRKATDPAVGPYALHLLDASPSSIAEAKRDIERFAGLTHPALAPLIDVFEHDDSLALVFEQVDGLRLDRLKGYLDRDRERLPDAAIWQLGWQTMGALAVAHLARDEHGALAPFVHGTLSPRDILVSWGGDLRVEGLCPLLAPQRSSDQDVESAPARVWLAPEVRRGDQASAKSDAYSMAMILRALLTGRPPEAMGASFRPLAVARPDLPSDVAHALDRALDAAPRLRPSCAELSQRLAGLANMTSSQAALQESMELYQALWGLWSVAAPEVWSQEEPALPPPEPSAVEEEGDSEASSSDSVPARDSTVELDWEDVERSPRTSRSPGQRAGSQGATGLDQAAPELSPDQDDRSDELSAAEGASPPAKPTADAGVGDVVAAEPLARPSAAVGPHSAPALPSSFSAGPPISERISTIPGQRPRTGSWGGWLAMGVLAVAAAVATWHFLGPDTTGSSGDGASPTQLPASGSLPSTGSAAQSAETGPGLGAGRRDGGRGADGATAGPASTEVSEPASPPAAKLLSFQGYLTVKSSVSAEVYVKGVSIGPTNHKNISHCRQKFVRLGQPPGPRWLTKGATVQIPCRAETTVTLEPDAATPPRP